MIGWVGLSGCKWWGLDVSDCEKGGLGVLLTVRVSELVLLGVCEEDWVCLSTFLYHWDSDKEVG